MLSDDASCGRLVCDHDWMYESVFELVDHFAADLPRSEKLAQPVTSIIRKLEARADRLRRRMRRHQESSGNAVLLEARGELKATETELLHWRVIHAHLTGSAVPTAPVPKGVWVVESPPRTDDEDKS